MGQVTKQSNTEQVNPKEVKNNLKRLKVAVSGQFERIEKKTGFTKGVVSSVLNGTYKGSEDTKEKILIAAKEVEQELLLEQAERDKRIAKILS